MGRESNFLEDSINASKFSPKEFLKSRRPERFSDSIDLREGSLNRSLLEYHLDSLTSRKQETLFEKFSKKLAERVVCPNLIPQTGPTGGGDSKVDTETFPVADSLTFGWYEGIGREAASERWAFAFSAKREWKQKIKDDVKKIAETQRDYKKTFFVSNQFISDRTRSQLEDELTKTYQMDVRIFDRAWILDQVFTRNLQNIAIEELDISVPYETGKEIGPEDAKKQAQLEKMEERINEKVASGDLGRELVWDAIKVAKLSLELELPRIDVEGYFARATRMANEFGTPHQQFEVVYQEAWGIHWWYEDYKLFYTKYTALEEKALDSENINHVESLFNLLNCLRAATSFGGLKDSEVNFQDHTWKLTEKLSKMSKNDKRASSALQAESMLVLLRISLYIRKPDRLEEELAQIPPILTKSAGLAGFPLESFAEILTELGDVLGEQPGYGSVFEQLLEIMSNREKDVVAGLMLLSRGRQKYNAEHHYEAIGLLGRSFRLLYKEESRKEAIRSLYICSLAFAEVGLLWAARGTCLTAASLATSEYWNFGRISIAQYACYEQLKSIDLRLGRIGLVFEWLQLQSVVGSLLLEKSTANREDFYKEHAFFDANLAILLLKTKLDQLTEITFLPTLLEGFGLAISSYAAQYVLGHDGNLVDDEEFKALNEKTIDFFLRLRNQPAYEQLPNFAQLYNASPVHMESNILGCRVLVTCENVSPCIEIAESLLSAMESMFATAGMENVFAHEPILEIIINTSEFASSPFGFAFEQTSGNPKLVIASKDFRANNLTKNAQAEIQELIDQMLKELLAKIFLIPDVETFFDRQFGQEKVHERAIGFTSSFVSTGNMLGERPKRRLSDWFEDGQKLYPVVREKTWDADNPYVSPPSDNGVLKKLMANNLTGIKHSEMATVSLIRLHLWEKADWKGVAYLFDPEFGSLPVLVPVFVNPGPAGMIFEDWLNRLGPEDEKNLLRISVILGIDRENPAHYRVMIGSNPDSSFPSPQMLMVTTRSHTMTPSTSGNIDNFLTSFNQTKGYLLMAGSTGGEQPPFDLDRVRFYRDAVIKKKELNVVQAWQVGLHDLERVVIFEDDKPIIPSGETNAPILEVLKERTKRSKPH